jgi:hypothetical protein
MRIFFVHILVCTLHYFSFATDKVKVSAAPPWVLPHMANSNRTVAAKNISNGYFLELVDQQVNLGNNTRYAHFIRNIVNETGVQNASEVSVSFAPQYEEVVFHTINLIRAGKIVNRLNFKDIRVVQEETDASDFQYNGLKRAFVALKDVQKNDKIEVAYSVIGFNPVFRNKYSEKIYFCSSTAISNYFETIIVPLNRTLMVQSFNGATAPVIETKGTEKLYRWSNPTTQAWESQTGVPSWFDNYPYVLITEYGSWQDVVGWGTSILNKYQNPLPENLQNKIREWRKLSHGDRDEFAVMALRYVQDHIRYLGLEMGPYTHQPHSPREVFEHSYGDCKDKSLLLATILQQERIPAYVALLSTTKKETMAKTAPSTVEFNHAIVAIERSSGYIYVDPTVSYQRGELINIYIPDYRYALVLRDGETSLRPMEADNFNVTLINESLSTDFTDSSQLDVTTVYKGGKADDIRSSLAGMSNIELEENYLQYYTKIFDGIQHAAPVTSTDDSLKNELTVTESYKIPELWNINGDGKQAFEVFAKAIYEQLPDPASAFKNGPLALSYPSTIYYTLTITMPELWNFPMNALHVKNDSYQFDFVPSMSGRVITLKYTLKTLKDNVPANELVQYKTDYRRIVDKLSFELSYLPNANTSGDGVTGKVNWNLVWFAFAALAGLSFLFRFLNKINRDVPYRGVPAQPIGSWLILLGLGLAASTIFRIISLGINNYFNQSTWTTLGESGGMVLQSVLVVELALQLLWLAGGIACFYWFIQRRDIFPRMFMGFIASILFGQLTLLIVYSVVKYPDSFGDLQAQAGADLFRSCFYAGIWVTYILRSERSKNTFVNTD